MKTKRRVAVWVGQGDPTDGADPLNWRGGLVPQAGCGVCFPAGAVVPSLEVPSTLREVVVEALSERVGTVEAYRWRLTVPLPDGLKAPLKAEAVRAGVGTISGLVRMWLMERLRQRND